MAQVDQVLEDDPCGAMVIEDDVGNGRDASMAGDGNGGKSGRLINGGVDGNDAFDASCEKQLGIGVHESVVMVVGDGQEEEIVLAEEPFDAADDHCAVGITNFLGDYADGVGALHAERTREQIRMILKLPGGLEDAVARVFRDGA